MITFLGLEHMVDATQDLRLGLGGVGWGGMITFFGLAHMVDATQDLRLGSGGVGWDDNVLWPCTHGRCHTKSKAGVGWGGVG